MIAHPSPVGGRSASFTDPRMREPKGYGVFCRPCCHSAAARQRPSDTSPVTTQSGRWRSHPLSSESESCVGRFRRNARPDPLPSPSPSRCPATPNGEAAVAAVFQVHLRRGGRADGPHRGSAAVDGVIELHEHRIVRPAVIVGLAADPEVVGSARLRVEGHLEEVHGVGEGRAHLGRAGIGVSQLRRAGGGCVRLHAPCAAADRRLGCVKNHIACPRGRWRWRRGWRRWRTTGCRKDSAVVPLRTRPDRQIRRRGQHHWSMEKPSSLVWIRIVCGPVA